jgi:hypothetical protein
LYGPRRYNWAPKLLPRPGLIVVSDRKFARKSFSIAISATD